MKISLDRRAELGNVRDQGRNPTCISHATTSAHEGRRPTPRPLSAEYLHHHAAGDFKRGANPNSISHALKQHGQPAQTVCTPFIHGTPWVPPTSTTTYKGTTQVLSTITEVIDAIRDGYHPVLCVELTEDLHHPAAPFIFTVGGATVGRHAMVAVGLGEHAGAAAIMVRNSWGPTWGDGGHGWLDAAYLTKHMQYAYIVEAN